MVIFEWTGLTVYSTIGIAIEPSKTVYLTVRMSWKLEKPSVNMTHRSHNVFEDLRLTKPQEKHTKVGLAVIINKIIENQGLSQGIVARRLKINQPKISALSNYNLEGFSVERLINFLTALDRDVEIAIRRKKRSSRTGRILVIAA
jgi:predicted XRE-type DNA-binding protein